MSSISPAGHKDFVLEQSDADAPSTSAIHTGSRRASFAGLTSAPARQSASRGDVAGPVRVTVPQTRQAAQVESGEKDAIRKSAAPLLWRRVNEIRGAQNEFLSIPFGVNQIFDRTEGVLTHFRAAVTAVQIVKGRGSNLGLKIADARKAERRADGQRPHGAEPGPLSILNRELTTFGDGYRSVLKSVEKIVDTRRLLKSHIEIGDETAQCRTPPRELEKIAGELDRNMNQACAAFDKLFDCIGRDLPELRKEKTPEQARKAGEAGDLEASWKQTLEVAVKSHMPDLLMTQGLVSMVHETLLHARFEALRLGFDRLRSQMHPDADPEAAQRVSFDDRQAAQLSTLLHELNQACNQYDDFARRADEDLRWIDGLRGKPHVDDSSVLIKHCDLLDASMRIDNEALRLFEHTREFGAVIDSGVHEPNAREAFTEVSRNMWERVAALQHNVEHCMQAFPNGAADVYLDKRDALRQPVLDAVAQHCDEIETDLAWLRSSVRNGASDPKARLVNPGEAERAYDRLQVAVSRIRRDLQWSIAVAEEMKNLATAQIAQTAIRRRGIVIQRVPHDDAVREYVNTHLKGLEVAAPGKATAPDFDWDDTPTTRPAVSAGSPLTKRARNARADRNRKQQLRNDADERDRAGRLRDATDSLARLYEHPYQPDGVRERAGALQAQAETETESNGLHLLSGNGVYGKFMGAANALRAGRKAALDRIAETDRLVETLVDLGASAVSVNEARKRADDVRAALQKHIAELSKEIDGLRERAAVEQKRRNLKQFAQNPTRERFLWLQKHASDSLVSVHKTVHRRKLSGIAPNGVPRTHDDYFDEYVVTLRDRQEITYLDPRTHEPRQTRVSTVPLHVHYRSADATRPEACHFKNEPQSKVGGPDAYRSDDSVALMAGVLKSVSDMALTTGAPGLASPTEMMHPRTGEPSRLRSSVSAVRQRT
ncbi:hypothetical protein [Burkholderia ambifaria]|jgi:hypothetical protein|uniref:hypothetical protein n=1 Tax=Burkholderia ambifaria TaxID=152480 RepID=UPI0011B24D12|nr:hypothetical protein [Burkholderia ambifaria]